MEQIDMNKIYKTNFGFAMDYKNWSKKLFGSINISTRK